ncbi:MAG TPA: hypothetical protein VJZ02_01325 [Candidatus Brocadiales bacterium]|nr:hypothetical protein [Candidatus Brocadiales bacterium]
MPGKKKVEYVVILEDGVRKRHYHEREKGKVAAFAVQIEVLVNNQWMPIIRYDASHGSAHVDRFYLDGRKEKIPLGLSFTSAVALADWDINNNWKSYIKDFKGR